MVNSSYNFGLILDDTSSSSINNLKSFTINYNNNTGLWELTSDLKDYFVEYYNRLQVPPMGGSTTYSGLVVYNKQGKNFIILTRNAMQETITAANFVYFTGAGTIPNINNWNSVGSITYPELPTFIDGFNGYNIPNSTLNVNVPYTFYIMD